MKTRIAYIINSLEGGGASSPVPVIADMLRGWGANVELDKTPDWPPQGAPVATAVYDSVLWPVDPVGP